MNDIIRLNATLTRKKFSIYGFFNIVSLILAITTSVIGVKYIQYLIGSYEESSILLLLFMVISFMPLVFPNKYEENCIRQKTFFSDLSMSAIQSYFSRKNIVIYQCFVTYLILPYDIAYIGTFSALIFLHTLVLFALIFLKSRAGETNFSTLYSGIKILIAVLIFIHLRSPFSIMQDNVFSIYITVLLLLLTGILFLSSLIWLKPKGFVIDAQVVFLTITKKIPLVRSNSDILMFIRKNMFLNTLVMIILSNIAFKSLVIEKTDSLITFLLSLLIAYFTIFLDFMNDEKDKIIFFYGYHNGKEIIKRKAKSTIQSSLILFPFVFAVCAFFVPINVMIVGYLLSTIIFSIAVNIVPFNAKRNKLTPLYSIKQMIALVMALFIIAFTVVHFVT